MGEATAPETYDLNAHLEELVRTLVTDIDVPDGSAAVFAIEVPSGSCHETRSGFLLAVLGDAAFIEDIRHVPINSITQFIEEKGGLDEQTTQ